MTLSNFLMMLDDWNTKVMVNDDNLNIVYHDYPGNIWNEIKLDDESEVVAFSHYNGEITVRVKGLKQCH